MNKRILYICPNGYLGGAEKFVYVAMKAHIQNGDNVEVLFFSDGQLVDLCRKENIPHHVLKTSFKLSQFGSLFKALREVREYIISKSFDVIHSTMPYAHIVASLALVGHNIKKVWFQHGPVGGTLDRTANLFQVDQIFFNSQYLRLAHNQMLFAFRNYDKQKIINLGIEKVETSLERAKEIREKYLGSQNKELWVMAGRITEWKGQHLLIQAISELKKSGDFNSFAKILIIGEAKRQVDKNYEKSLKDLVKNSGLEEDIELVGHQSDLHNFFSASDVTFHCSTTPEPFGLVAAEAMLQKSLVIGSSEGGINDILLHEVSGLTYNTTTSNAPKLLASVIKKYIAGEYPREQLVDYAFELIEDKYSCEQMLKSMNDSYQKLFR